MRAFGIFSIAAAAALSFLPSAFAAPLVDADAVALAGAHVGREVAVAAAADAYAGVEVRGVGSCVEILADLKVDLAVHISALGGWQSYLAGSQLTLLQAT